MKNLYLSVIFALFAVNISAQNPFAKLSYNKVPVISVKGNHEFHKNKDVVEVGSVVFNVKTNTIVSFIDSSDIELAYRFLSIDPLAEKYYHISPYVYCANNPIKYIDPDGRKIVFTVGVNEYTYTPKGGLISDVGKEVYIPINSQVRQIIDVYNKILSSGDSKLMGQLTDLVESDNIHYISSEVAPRSSSVSPGDRYSNIYEINADVESSKRMGTTAGFNLTNKRKQELKDNTGVEHSNFSIVVHEMQHQHDYDKGKMAGRTRSSSTDPAEIRAVNNENRARKIEGMQKRTRYGGEEIDPNELD